jgi:hypothetical protein
MPDLRAVWLQVNWKIGIMWKGTNITGFACSSYNKEDKYSSQFEKFYWEGILASGLKMI